MRHDTLLDILNLERVELDLFRGNFVCPDPLALYGGQVAAQALRAAGLTVEQDRLPHSLHGYFLRPGDASLPTVFQVFRDRDGRSFSARRVVALQRGKVIFNMSASFHAEEKGIDEQIPALPEVPAPDDCPVSRMPRLFSFESRQVEQPYGDTEWPTRFWARCTAPLGTDPLLNACALTYVSDISSGLAPFNSPTDHSGSSLDHAVWFHRDALLTDWVLIDMVPRSIAGGRGWYHGALFDRDGALVASLTQEALFRRRR
ncbi:acyl-CoA thioesterase [Streptomyces sp. NPDC059262]|uniref:acyl-CoA thioesterase n=1 Tax=Streptomyces sp. NPDC059262 TaxID=3346797 RepID=UPI0036C659ED